MNYIGKILPIDGYVIHLNESYPIHYTFSLTHLYQPLIGVKAISLYQTLLHEYDLQKEHIPQTHHTLINYLNLPLDEIYKERLKLEGIGLLKTYESETASEQTIFTYEMVPPFAPAEFFLDDMLAELLFHHIGEEKYSALKQHFLLRKEKKQQTEITASFNDVFGTFQPVFSDNPPPFQRENNKRVSSVDFTSLETMLQQRMIPVHQVLTAANRKLISEMVHLYDLPLFEIENALLWALTEENRLDKKEFRVACNDLFKQTRPDHQIKLVSKRETHINQSQKEEENLSKDEQMIRRLESISPRELLEDLSKGKKASAQDLRVISEVMTDQGIPIPVMNVLIHYVLLQSNMRLSKPYLETIASHWSRAKLTTAREAFNFAKSQVNQYKQQAEKRNYKNRKNNKKEVIPSWFKDRKKQSEESPDQQDSAKLEQERQELAALIQQYAKEE